MGKYQFEINVSAKGRVTIEANTEKQAVDKLDSMELWEIIEGYDIDSIQKYNKSGDK